MTSKLWRKGPIVIEAVQYDGFNAEAICVWIDSGTNKSTTAYTSGSNLTIGTLEGDMHVAVGDYVICGVHGEHYPCKPEIFAATYEAEMA